MDGTPIAIGDVVDVSGRFTVFNGQLELAPSVATASSATATVPAPVIALPAEVDSTGSRANALEGVLIRVEGVTVTSVSAPRFVVGSALTVDNFIYTVSPFPTVGRTYSSLTGVLVYRFLQHRLNPRQASDVVP
ncbi:MAG: hypothetical protein KC619_11130 [Myxococcales bacterium]|nr:hypothetical protein [Myxococcales bacterium]